MWLFACNLKYRRRAERLPWWLLLGTDTLRWLIHSAREEPIFMPRTIMWVDRCFKVIVVSGVFNMLVVVFCLLFISFYFFPKYIQRVKLLLVLLLTNAMQMWPRSCLLKELRLIAAEPTFSGYHNIDWMLLTASINLYYMCAKSAEWKINNFGLITPNERQALVDIDAMILRELGWRRVKNFIVFLHTGADRMIYFP